MEQETFSSKKWDKVSPPERILIIRLHAIGDTALTIPACNSLRKLFPSATIDYLTNELSAPLISAACIANNVYAFKDFSSLSQAKDSLQTRLGKLKEIKEWGVVLKKNNYDVIIDLQRNRVSRLLRFFIGGGYYAEFDRFSKNPASLRVLHTFHRAGFDNVTNDCNLDLKTEQAGKAKQILFKNGWDGKTKLIVLNPAGHWQTRNWPIENYVNLARIILKDEDVKFLLIGNEKIAEKAKYLEEKLAGNIINLTGKTQIEDVLRMFRLVYATVTEDSALIHISWAMGVPTLALLGSTRSDWTSPLPPHGASLNSTDLPCGDCMEAICKFGDVHCLTRFTPEAVYEKLKELTATNYTN